MQKLGTIAFLFALLSSCAKPDYGEPDPGPGSGASKPTAGATLPACALAFPKTHFCGSIEWSLAPTDSAYGQFMLTLWPRDAAAPADPRSTVFVLLWMPDMGHGSAPTEITRSAAGRYRVGNVSFIMPGRWQIRVQLRNGATIIDEADFAYFYKGGG